MKGIDPNVSIWLNIVAIVLSGLSIPTLQALGFGDHSTQILAWTGVIELILNAVLHAYSSSTPGPAAQQDSATVKAAMKLSDLPATAGVAARDAAKQELSSAVSRLP